jgi:DNA-binding response OmpR family regulator
MHKNGTQPGGARKQVLVVEDHEETALLVTMILEDEGYEVKRARRADEALRVCCMLPAAAGESPAAQPDIVLLDLTLPDMDYTEMARRLGECRDTAPPVIVVSAMPDKNVNAAAHTIGAAGVVRKPFSVEVLLACIDRTLAVSPPAQAPGIRDQGSVVGC